MNGECPNLRDAPYPPTPRLPEGHWWAPLDEGGWVRDGDGLVWGGKRGLWVCLMCGAHEPPVPTRYAVLAAIAHVLLIAALLSFLVLWAFG